MWLGLGMASRDPIGHRKIKIQIKHVFKFSLVAGLYIYIYIIGYSLSRLSKFVRVLPIVYIYIYIYIYIYVETHIHLRVEHAHPRVDMETHIRFDSSFANLGILFELIAWAFDNVRRKGSWCASQYDGEWQVPSNYAWHGANALS